MSNKGLDFENVVQNNKTRSTVLEWPIYQLENLVNIQTGHLDSNQAKPTGIYPFFTCAPEPLKIDDYAFDCDAIIMAGNNANGVFHLNRYCGKFNAYQRTYVIVPKESSLIDIKFLYYFLQTLKFQLGHYSQGTATKFLTMKILSSLSIPIPSIEYQRAIAHILGTLDEKIELNRQMNETLEEMARTIFKSWFIDFDPVHAKAEGREPFGMDAETAALFPDEFEDSELGMIPKGWKISTVSTFCNVKYGSAYSSKHFNDEKNGRPLIRIRDLKTFNPDIYTTELISKDDIIVPGEILVGMDAEFNVTRWYGLQALLNQRVCCFRPISPEYETYFHLAIEKPIKIIEGYKTGTTVKHLSKTDIDDVLLLEPQKDIIVSFDELVRPVFEKIIGNHHSNRILEQIRDLLIPVLIEGKVRIDVKNYYDERRMEDN